LSWVLLLDIRTTIVAQVFEVMGAAMVIGDCNSICFFVGSVRFGSPLRFLRTPTGARELPKGINRVQG
jgi:hypothetical protein